MMYRRFEIVEERGGWRIWDTKLKVYRGKYGSISADYRATSEAVARMRVRDWRWMAGTVAEMHAEADASYRAWIETRGASREYHGIPQALLSA